MDHLNSRASWHAGIALAFLLSTSSHAAISMTDIQIWAGTGPNQAALVIDWADGQPALVWGFRWEKDVSKNGTDLLLAVVGADPRLHVPGLSTASNFIGTIEFDANADGIYERSGTNTGAPTFSPYWGYLVNNAVYNDPVDFHLNAHLLPPNGNPYTTGSWEDSSTGIFDRPLANGSWDGYVLGNFGARALEPVPAMPLPESSITSTLILALAVLGWRRK